MLYFLWKTLHRYYTKGDIPFPSELPLSSFYDDDEYETVFFLNEEYIMISLFYNFSICIIYDRQQQLLDFDLSFVYDIKNFLVFSFFLLNWHSFEWWW